MTEVRGSPESLLDRSCSYLSCNTRWRTGRSYAGGRRNRIFRNRIFSRRQVHLLSHY